MCSCLVHGIVIVQQFHLNKGYSSSYYCSTAGGARAVESTRKYSKVYPCLSLPPLLATRADVGLEYRYVRRAIQIGTRDEIASPTHLSPLILFSVECFLSLSPSLSLDILAACCSNTSLLHLITNKAKIHKHQH